MNDHDTLLQSDIDALILQWNHRYGVAPNTLVLTTGPVILSGFVFTYDQVKEVQALAERHAVILNVRALEDPTVPPPYGYWVPDSLPLNVWRSVAFSKLTTQVVQGDAPMRGLVRIDSPVDAMLVQCDDQTLGWVPSASALPTSITPTRVNPLDTHETLDLSPPTDVLWAAARLFLGVPYVLGGRSETGIDCSGLMSRIFRAACGIVLFRHSMDQMRCGVRVSREQVRPGDLVFARLNNTHIAHVALVLGEAPDQLKFVHASQTRGMVVNETPADFYQNYRFMAARRIWTHTTS